VRIYVAGPIGEPPRPRDVHRAIKAGLELIAAGHSPHVPHLWAALEAEPQVTRDEWLRVDLDWLEVADAVLRLPGDSPGADLEEARARELGLPVYHSAQEIP
jgi:hypothetical protein